MRQELVVIIIVIERVKCSGAPFEVQKPHDTTVGCLAAFLDVLRHHHSSRKGVNVSDKMCLSICKTYWTRCCNPP